jgi:hypothetical protein
VNLASLTATIGLDGGESITCTFTNIFDTGLHIQQTQAYIQNFLAHRIQQLADDEPDRNRMIRRIPGALWGDNDAPADHAGAVTGPLNFTGSGGDDSSRLSMSTSLSQIEAFARTGSGQSPSPFGTSPGGRDAGAKPYDAFGKAPKTATTSGLDVWAEAHFNSYRANIGTLDTSGRFNIAYLGADYLLTRSMLVGALIQVDSITESAGAKNASGNGWMAGPYMTVRLAPNVFFDARAAWGTSQNQVNPFGLYQDGFSTDRFLARGNLTGNWWFGNFRVTPSASMVYVAEQQRNYIDSLGILIPSQTVSLGRLGAGPEIAYRIVGRDGTTYEPHAAIKANWNFVKPGSSVIDGLTINQDAFSAEAQAGVMARLTNGLAIRVVAKYDGIASSSYHSYGGQVWVNIPLH